MIDRCRYGHPFQLATRAGRIRRVCLTCKSERQLERRLGLPRASHEVRMQRALRLDVTFDYNGYQPATDRYPVTCPGCNVRTLFRIAGGKWPTHCPACVRPWRFEGVTTVESRSRESRARRRAVCPARAMRNATRKQSRETVDARALVGAR